MQTMHHSAAPGSVESRFDRAVLHFGGDKTGSTAIQAVFDDARERLRQEGVAYPPGRFHAQLGSYFCDRPESFIFNVHNGVDDRVVLKQLDRVYFDEMSDWLEHVEGRRVVVFSYEGFSELDQPALERMKAYCESIAREVRVLYYVRAPLSYAASAMSQRVKQGRGSWSGDILPVSPHREFLGKIARVFGKGAMCVRPFARDRLRNGDIVDDFCEFVGVDSTWIEGAAVGERRTNESLSLPALIAGDALIREIADRGVFIGEAEFYERYGRHLSGIPGERIRLPPRQIGEVLAASREHTLFLATEFGVTFDEDSTVMTRFDDTSSARDEVFRDVGRVLAAVGRHDRARRADFELDAVSLRRARIVGSGKVMHGDTVCFEAEFSVAKAFPRLETGIQIFDDDGRLAFGTNTSIRGRPLLRVGPGAYRLRCHVVANLPAGVYSLGLALAEENGGLRDELAWYDKVAVFEVMVPRAHADIGYLSLPVEFELQRPGGADPETVDDGRGRVECLTPLSEMGAGEATDLKVRLCNASSQVWRGAAQAPIFLSYHWVAQDGAMVVFDGERSPLGADSVSDGQCIDSLVRVVAPNRAGRHRLLILPVQEGHHWFDELGFTPASLDVVVTPPASAERG